MLNFNIPQLVSEMHPNAKVSFNGRGYEDMVWLDKLPKPSLEEIEDYAKIKAQREGMLDHRIRAIESFHKKTDAEIAKAAEELAAPVIEDLKKAHEAKIEATKRDLIEKFRNESLDREEQQLNAMWLEIVKGEEKKYHEAINYLQETSHLVLTCAKCGHEEGGVSDKEDLLQKREEARNTALRAKMVYMNWSQLRSKEYPSREERIAAIRAGGVALLELKKKIEEVNSKYHRPTRDRV